MRLLTQTHDHVDMLRIRMLLESKGIPVFVANEDTARNFFYGHPANKLAINIVYDHQYDDAVALLQNEDHQVSDPINMDEYAELSLDNSPDHAKTIYKFFVNIIIVFFIVVFTIFFYVRVRH